MGIAESLEAVHTHTHTHTSVLINRQKRGDERCHF